MKYFLDASSLMFSIKKLDAKLAVEYLLDSLIIDLTSYEIGNAILKESALLNFLTSEEAKMMGSRSKLYLPRSIR
jgi:hypothetical protein